jgi:predicted transcriptional regulator
MTELSLIECACNSNIGNEDKKVQNLIDFLQSLRAPFSDKFGLFELPAIFIMLTMLRTGYSGLTLNKKRLYSDIGLSAETAIRVLNMLSHEGLIYIEEATDSDFTIGFSVKGRTVIQSLFDHVNNYHLNKILT